SRPICAHSSEWVSRVRGTPSSGSSSTPTTCVLAASRRSAAECSTRARSRSYGLRVAGVAFDGSAIQRSLGSAGVTARRAFEHRRAAGLQPGDGHPERRARHVVEPDLVEELDAVRITAVLAADTEVDVGASRPALLHGDAHERTDALDVERLERGHPEHALLQVVGEE